jgi:hypothetical protein
MHVGAHAVIAAAGFVVVCFSVGARDEHKVNLAESLVPAFGALFAALLVAAVMSSDEATSLLGAARGAGAGTSSSSSSSHPALSSSSTSSSRRLRAFCAWVSKRKAISYDDLALTLREEDALEDLRRELVEGDNGLRAVSGEDIARWQSLDQRRGAAGEPLSPGKMEGAEARIELLFRQLWGAVFSVESTAGAREVWGKGCVCPAAAPSSAAASDDETDLLGFGAGAPPRTAPVSTSGVAASSAGRCPFTAASSAEGGGGGGGGEGVPYPTIPSRSWVALGFQQNDPRTDLRAVGPSGVVYLVRLLTEGTLAPSSAGAASLTSFTPRGGYRARALAIAVGCARGVDMPLAIAAFNAQYMLACHLHLLRSPPAFCPCCGASIRQTEYGSRSAQSHRGASLRGFLAVLAREPDAFFHLYACAVLMLAREWEDASLVVGGGGRGAAGGGREGGREGGEGAGGPTRGPPCLDLEGGGVPVGDVRLLQFPAMLSRVRQRIMAALAGASELPASVGTLASGGQGFGGGAPLADADAIATAQSWRAGQKSPTPKRRRASYGSARLTVRALRELLLAEEDG